MKKYAWPENRKYITKNKKGIYIIQKNVNGKMRYYGSFKDYNDAIRVRDKCIKYNWDKNLQPKNPMRYITKNKGAYVIQKNYTRYGRYHNLSDAMNERDLLVKYDWDYDKLCECHDERTCERTIFLGRRV